MKQRQTVPKPIAIAILAILFVAISAAQLMAQSPQAKEHSKLQKSVEWPNYQANWKKVELAKAKEVKKINKERSKEAKDRQRFFAKLERIKN